MVCIRLKSSIYYVIIFIMTFHLLCLFHAFLPPAGDEKIHEMYDYHSLYLLYLQVMQLRCSRSKPLLSPLLPPSLKQLLLLLLLRVRWQGIPQDLEEAALGEGLGWEGRGAGDAPRTPHLRCTHRTWAHNQHKMQKVGSRTTIIQDVRLTVIADFTICSLKRRILSFIFTSKSIQ